MEHSNVWTTGVPPRTFSSLPQPTAPTNPIYLLPNDTTATDALIRDILSITRDNRSFQMASIEQQNLLIDQLDRLNQQWTADQQDRQAELRGLYARVDQLRADLIYFAQGQGRVQIVGMPQPQAANIPQWSTQPLQRPPSTVSRRASMPTVIHSFPPGFVPQPGPPIISPSVTTPSRLSSESSTDLYTTNSSSRPPSTM